MAYGLCGAHRTGKTSLAEAVAKEISVPFVKVSSSSVFKREGLDPAQAMTFSDRLAIQWLLMEEGINCWAGSSGIFVTDRTPIDMAAYMLCDITGEVASTDAEHRALVKYLNACKEVTGEFFSTLILVQPGIKVVEDPEKLTARLNRSYMENLNVTMMGLLMNLKEVKSYAMPPKLLDFDARREFVIDRVIARMETHSQFNITGLVH